MPKEEPEKYPILLGPTDDEGRQEVLTFTPDGVERGRLGPVGADEEGAAAKVRIEQQMGPLGTMEVIEGSVRSGPPRVNSPAYRANFDTIFGGKQEVGEA